MNIDMDKLVHIIVDLVFWHPTTREYFYIICKQAVLDQMSDTKTEDNSKAIQYIKEHGNSAWAKIDLYAGKARMILMLLAIVAVIVMMVMNNNTQR